MTRGGSIFQTLGWRLVSSDDDWRRRWLVTPSWGALHRIAAIEWHDGERLGGPGVAVCGLRAVFQMPGVLSRMGLKRCQRCCARLGLPAGNGAPFNALGGEQRQA